jgi:hypothetical protein
MGRMQGEVIHRVHPAPGNVLYMVGPPRSYPTRSRLRGAREFLEPKGYNILAIIESNWEGIGAEEAGVSAALGTYHQLLTGAQGLSDLPADRVIESRPSCYPPLDAIRTPRPKG